MRPDQRRAAASRLRAASRIVCVCSVARGIVSERVARVKSSKRSRSTTVRHTPPARAQPPRDPVDDGDERRVDLLERLRPAAQRALRADRAPAAPGPDAPRVAVVRERVEVPAGRAPEQVRRAAARRARRPARRSAGRGRGASPAVTRPTPQSRSTGSGWRKPSSSSGGTTSRPFGFATALATFARNFVRAMPTVIGSPTSSSTRRRSRAAISRAPREPFEPADVEERLVDREPLDERRRVLEDREHGLARLRVRRHPRRDDDGVRAEPPRLAAAHRRLDAVRLRLVARREHDPAADDHRCPRRRGSSRCSTEAKNASRSAWRIVASTYEHMFAPTAVRGDKRELGKPAVAVRASARACRASRGRRRTPRPGRSSPARRRPRGGARPRRRCSRPSPGRPGARGPDRDDDARPVSGADDRVLRRSAGSGRSPTAGAGAPRPR